MWSIGGVNMMDKNFYESNEMELKENYSNSFLKTVSAFSNQRDGVIIFGVADNGNVIGVTDDEELRLRVENAINDNIKPNPKFGLETKIIHDKKIVFLKVYRGDDIPYFYKNQAYQRSDTSSVPADHLQLRRWIMKSSNVSFDQIVIEEKDFTFSNLEKSLMEEVGIANLTTDIMRTMGLMNGDKYVYAGKLFADKNNITTGIDSVKFGDSVSQLLKRKTITGVSILEQYDKILAFFDEFYYEYEEIVEAKRIKRIMIPKEAFREAIANAIVHKDYLINANIRVSFWDDHIEIVSPGGLVEGITEEEFKSGKISMLRNETIASVFRRLNIIESYATGIVRIKELYKAFLEEPKFEVTKNSITVILPRIDYKRKAILDDRVNEILTLLEGEPRGRLEIQEKLQLSKTKTNHYLNLMQDLKLISKVGKGKATKYHIYVVDN